MRNFATASRHSARGEGNSVQSLFYDKTRRRRNGSCLSLSSYDIVVKQHAGSIDVDTQPGEFTEFKVILPRKAALSKAGIKS